MSDQRETTVNELVDACKYLRWVLRRSLNVGPPLHGNVTRENRAYYRLWAALDAVSGEPPKGDAG